MGDIDILFLPVGGAYTIDAEAALAVIAQIPSLKIVVPMHYYVSGITPWNSLAPLSEFTQLASSAHTLVEKGSHLVVIDAETLPETLEIWLLDAME